MYEKEKVSRELNDSISRFLASWYVTSIVFAVSKWATSSGPDSFEVPILLVVHFVIAGSAGCFMFIKNNQKREG